MDSAWCAGYRLARSSWIAAELCAWSTMLFRKYCSVRCIPVAASATSLMRCLSVTSSPTGADVFSWIMRIARSILGVLWVGGGQGLGGREGGERGERSLTRGFAGESGVVGLVRLLTLHWSSEHNIMCAGG